ncbi:hypothetical protein [Erwinia billingiae]|uniref:hypothetical protein n=1 Tax=Erwinia billingiae TaxID=182337 RepID=UPI002245F6AA|nr:hypothetical protein [Erwinia billingiae]MCX0499353.1 hypothetical protein [Erwinia billingiae]
MRNLLRLIATILFFILIVTIGVFISRILFYFIEVRSFNIPLIEIFKVSLKAGVAGGLVGGVGVYLIPYFATKMPKL